MNLSNIPSQSPVKNGEIVSSPPQQEKKATSVDNRVSDAKAPVFYKDYAAAVKGSEGNKTYRQVVVGSGDLNVKIYEEKKQKLEEQKKTEMTASETKGESLTEVEQLNPLQRVISLFKKKIFG